MECEKNEGSENNERNENRLRNQQHSGDHEASASEDGSAGNVANSNGENFANAMDLDDKTVKIVVFGKDGAGKTALIVRLLTRRFIHEYDPTSEDVYAHHCIVDGDEVRLKIMDTAGKVERNMHEREEQIRWGDGFLLVLSLTNENSLEVLHLIRALIEKVNASEKPMALVANKRDLLHAREVTSAAVSDLAIKWNCRVFETSATEDYSVVEEPFIFLCSEIMNKKMSTAEPPAKTKIDNELILADAHKRFQPKFQENFSDRELQLENTEILESL